MGGRKPSRIEHIEPYYLGLSQLFDRSPDPVIVGEAGTGRVVLWNPAASRLFGYTQEEAVGLLIEDLVPDELKERHRAGMVTYARTGHGPLLDAMAPVAVTAVRKDGETVRIELSLSPIRHGRLSGSYVLAIIRDVTERVRSEERRRKMDAERASFIANAAHELRTPLTTIYGFVSLLAERRHELPEEQLDEFFATLKRTGERVNTMISSLLDLSRIEHGEAVDLRPTSLRGAVDAALEICPPPLGISVRVEVPEDLEVMTDPDKLGRIVVNLITNAYRYGGGSVRVEGMPEGAGAMLAVSDDGAGVPDDLVPHLFDPFSRGANAQAKQGSGLGLAITRGLVEMLGAQISYRDAHPGARFELRFPPPPGNAKSGEG